MLYYQDYWLAGLRIPLSSIYKGRDVMNVDKQAIEVAMELVKANISRSNTPYKALALAQDFKIIHKAVADSIKENYDFLNKP